MIPFHPRILFASLWVLAACAASEPPPAAPPPEPAADSVAAPPPEPEITLEERLEAPFTVRSNGQRIARDHEHRVASADSEPAPPPPADTAARIAAAEPEREPEPAPEAPTAPAERAPDARPAAGEHTVAVGETFYGIANRYGVAAAALRAANPDVDIERIRVGQTLRVPAAGAPARAPRTHTVVRGDTLFGIARRYGVTPQQLRDANRLEDDTVRLGQTLTLPGA